jgi:aromatic ring-opening dioxygenase catalytic subunit (LigB family)
MAAWLRGLAEGLPERPKGIIVISGHWEEEAFTASAMARPDMIFDYYGFPPHTYELNYPAPGNPALAERVRQLLADAGLPAAVSADRGFDHGVFVPFLLAFPDADIPVVPLSLRSSLDPEEHLAAGRALAALRDEGVLIVGSGMSYHNMQGYSTPGAAGVSARFDDWLTDAVEADDPTERWRKLARWEDSAEARPSHPREEHLLPLMVAAGAASGERGEKIFSDQVMVATVSAFRFG